MTDFNAEVIEQLREAIANQPTKASLYEKLGQALLRAEIAIEAEMTFKKGLSLDPHSYPMKLGLAEAFYAQEKWPAALVLVESLLKENTTAELQMLYAKLLFQTQQSEQALQYYQRAIKDNHLLREQAFEIQLGLSGETENEQPEKVKVAYQDMTLEDDAPLNLEKPEITFDDVGGMDELKEEIRLKIIYPLEKPEIYEAYGKKIGGGILLYGPPGCGKTLLARATAGQINSSVIAVSIHDVLDMWLGESEKKLHELFEQARRLKPCVLFFDEVDALGASRSDMKHSGIRHTINQFLSELDGATGNNDGVLILGATNVPWFLDSAFRRPGRFDRIIFVPPPDFEARKSILELLLKDKPTASINYAQLAKKSDGFSGADLSSLVERAVEIKLHEALKKGVPKPITNKELLQVLKKQSPTTKEWFNTAKNYALHSNQSGFYDDILSYLNIKK